MIIDDDVELEGMPFGVSHKPSGVHCKHLRFDENKVASCAIHNDPRYKETPCYDFTQIGKQNDSCRIGVGIVKGIITL